MSDYKPLPCPFCGSEIRTGDDYIMDGNHPESCYFHFVDNQNDYDFLNPVHLKLLHKAWNTRTPLSTRKESDDYENRR